MNGDGKRNVTFPDAGGFLLLFLLMFHGNYQESIIKFSILTLETWPQLQN